jgi:hypothetical protein
VQHALSLLFGQVLALLNLEQRARVVAVPVRPIRHVHHRVAADDVERRAEQALFCLTPKEDVAALMDERAGPVLQVRSLLLAPVLVLLACGKGVYSTCMGT